MNRIAFAIAACLVSIGSVAHAQPQPKPPQLLCSRLSQSSLIMCGTTHGEWITLLDNSGEVVWDSSNADNESLVAVADQWEAIWGWRPYIRLQRISAAAEG